MLKMAVERTAGGVERKVNSFKGFQLNGLKRLIGCLGSLMQKSTRVVECRLDNSARKREEHKNCF